MCHHPSLEDMIKCNNIFAMESAPKPVGIFIGGTSGIGEHVAFKFAEYSSKPTIYIIGRDADSGARVLANLPKYNPDPDCRFFFIQCDVSLIENCDRFCKTIMACESFVNVLFMSQGIVSVGRKETEEGLDKKMVLNYYGRWRIVNNLIPLLENAAAMQKDKNATTNRVNARVVSLLAPGNEGPVILDDLELKNHYTKRQYNRHIVEFNSLAVMRFARKFPEIGFIHAHPGIVRGTGIARTLSWFYRYPSYVFLFFGNSPSNVAERLMYILTSPDYRYGAHLLDCNLNSFKEKAEKRNYLSEKLQNKVWDHTEKMHIRAIAHHLNRDEN